MISNSITPTTLAAGLPVKSVERTGKVYILLPGSAESRTCARLEQLGERIAAVRPGIKAQTLSSPASSIFLNCYVAISVPGRNESLIASVAYRNNMGRFVVTADVCGEESGSLVWERPDLEVNPNEIQQVDSAIHEATEDLLAHSIDSILEALK